MKTILAAFFLLLSVSVFAQAEVKPDSLATAMADSADIIDTTHTHIELQRISPQPFYDFLQFDFKVMDDSKHEVKIYVVNSQNELVFFESVLVYPEHEKIRISTIDFFMTGLYSIQVKIDGKYQYFRSFKRTKY
jgi:hypothetical protein